MTDDEMPGPAAPDTAEEGSAALPVPVPGDPAEPPAQAFDRRMLEALVCPVTQSGLSYDASRQELVSDAAKLAFPIRGGIPIMLITEARPLD